MRHLSHIFRLLYTVFYTFAFVFFGAAGIVALLSRPATRIPDGIFKGMGTDPGAVFVLFFLSILSLIVVVIIALITPLWTDLRNWLRQRGARMGGTIRLITGLVLVISSIALSEKITGDNPLRDLACAAICLAGLWFGFRNIGLSELRTRRCYREFKPGKDQVN